MLEECGDRIMKFLMNDECDKRTLLELQLQRTSHLQSLYVSSK